MARYSIIKYLLLISAAAKIFDSFAFEEITESQGKRIAHPQISARVNHCYVLQKEIRSQKHKTSQTGLNNFHVSSIIRLLVDSTNQGINLFAILIHQRTGSTYVNAEQALIKPLLM